MSDSSKKGSPAPLKPATGGGVCGDVTLYVRVALNSLSERQRRPILCAWDSASSRRVQTAVNAKTGVAVITVNLDEQCSNSATKKTTTTAAVGNNAPALSVWLELLAEEASLMGRRAVYGHAGTCSLSVDALVAIVASSGGSDANAAAPIAVDANGTLKPPVAFDLTLFNYTTRRTDVQSGVEYDAPFKKSSVTLERVVFSRHDEVVAAFRDGRLFVAEHASATTSLQLSQSTRVLFDAVNEMCVGRNLYMFMDAAAEQKVAMRGTHAISTRVIMPYRATNVGLVWGPSYAIFTPEVAHKGTVDEQHLHSLLLMALQRDNFTADAFIRITSEQLARNDDTYDTRFTRCLGIMARAVCEAAWALPYQSDFVDTASRTARFNFLPPSTKHAGMSKSHQHVHLCAHHDKIRRRHRRSGGGASSRAPVSVAGGETNDDGSAATAPTSANVDVESYDDALHRLGGDCEDCANVHLRYAMALYHGRGELRDETVPHRVNGGFETPLVDAAQRLMSIYVPTMQLCTVTSPSLQHEKAKAEPSKNAWVYPHMASCMKTLAQAKHASRRYANYIRAANGGGGGGGGATGIDLGLGDAMAEKFPIVNSKEDEETEVGGHMFSMLIAKTTFCEMLRRMSPDLPLDDVYRVLHGTTDSRQEAMERAPAWLAYVPSALTLEGTGRLSPMALPDAAYQVTREQRVEAHRAQVAEQVVVHHVFQKMPALRAFDVEGRPMSTVNTTRRVTAFYRTLSACFTPVLFNKTGNAEFLWINTSKQPAAATSVPASASALLYENDDALMDTRSIITRVKQLLPVAPNKQVALSTAFMEQSGIRTHLSDALPLTEAAAAAGVRQTHALAPRDASMGVEFEHVLQQRPLNQRVALLPTGALDKLEVAVLREYLRHVPAFLSPTFALPSLKTARPESTAFVRVSDANLSQADPQGVARLVVNDALVDAQRARATRLLDAVNKASKNAWPSDTQARRQRLTLATFSTHEHELTTDAKVDELVTQLTASDLGGVVYASRCFYQEPLLHMRQLVVQFMCDASRVPPDVPQETKK